MPMESVTYRTVPVDCQRSTSGGKGNIGNFIERNSKICAAGLPTAQPDKNAADNLQHYLLKDEADCLISDAIIPPPKPKPLPPLRKPRRLDLRHAGPYSAAGNLVNPPMKTKFQTLVDDFKSTTYKTYWKVPLGKVQDSVPMLPAGMNTTSTTFGKPTPFHGRLYDIVMPKEPLPDATPHERKPGVQKNRNLCEPAFNADLFYGYRSHAVKNGQYASCCLTDDSIVTGSSHRTVMNSIQANFQDSTRSQVGSSLTPNNNIMEVPEGYSFGKLKPPSNIDECFSDCDKNPDQEFVRKCFGHLNSVRSCNRTKQFLPIFYQNLYHGLKYLDKEKSGWLPNDVVYKYIRAKLIILKPALIEPLLSLINAFDGSRIEYKLLLHLLNYRQNCPDFPKIAGLPEDCLDYRTTYTEMIKPGQKVDGGFRAGLPSGRYFDMDYPITPEGYCKAHRVCMIHESDVKSCLYPNILTLMNVSHRDMYQAREPHVVKRVFESAGEKFSDERFDTIWKEAQAYHSQGLVCYETFRKALSNSTGKPKGYDKA